MSTDLTLDMDHFGNPATTQEPGSPEEDDAFNTLLRKQIDALPPIPGSPNAWAVSDATGVNKNVTPPESTLNSQKGGDHYKKLGQYQPWQVLAEWMTPAELRGFMKGTVIAYLSREADKGGDLDIEKALHTIQLWQEVRKDKVNAE